MRRSRLGALAAAAAVLAAPAIAFADRPGTPSGERAWQCNGASEPPAVCVEFNNTATEPVRFDIEFTVDGVSVGENRPRATDLPDSHPARRHCIGCEPFKDLPDHISGAAQNFNYGSDRYAPMEGRTGSLNRFGDPIPTYGFKVVGLEYDSDYCFRLKARRASDAVVSENWSNWTCARPVAPVAAAAPPMPSAPEYVTAEYLPGGKDWRVKPPTVVVRWGYGSHAASYSVSRDPPAGGRGSISRKGEAREAVDTLTEEDIAANEANPSIVYKVCAINAAGSACRTRTTYVAVGDAVPLPPRYQDDVTVPNKPEQDSNRHVPTTMDNGQVGRPRGGVGADVSVPAGQGRAQSNACDPGYVWRVARSEDLVCVVPAARTRIRRENADGPSHVDPAGAYGPNSCAPGYVWREAFDGDAVCVTPQARDLARQENAAAQGHRTDAGEVFRDPH
jgi:hypothetical protein